MATGISTDFVLRDSFFRAGMLEKLDQSNIAFNGASQGAISLSSMPSLGDYTNNDFFPRISGLLSDRDPDDVTDATPTKITQDTMTDVKISKRIGPFEQTLDSLRKIAVSEEEISFLVGQQAGEEIAKEYFNVGAKSLRSAIENAGATFNLDKASETARLTHLTDGLALMGDASDRVVVWLMNSKAYHNLVGDSLANYKIDSLAGVTAYGGSPATAGRPVIVSDVPDLKYTDTTEKSDILGLTSNSIRLKESSFVSPITERITGKKNIIFRMQGEYDYTLGLKGFTWDVANGGKNPNSAALTLGTNWDLKFSDVKDGAGIRIKTLE